MLLAVRPQTGPSLVCTVVPAVHDAAVWAVTAAACGVAEAPPTEATVSPAARAAAAAATATARSSFIPRDDAELIIFRVIAKLLRLKYELDPPFSPALLGWLTFPRHTAHLHSGWPACQRPRRPGPEGRPAGNPRLSEAP